MTSVQAVNLGQPVRCSSSQLLALKKQNEPEGKWKEEEVESACIFNQCLHLLYHWVVLFTSHEF